MTGADAAGINGIVSVMTATRHLLVTGSVGVLAVVTASAAAAEIVLAAVAQAAVFAAVVPLVVAVLQCQRRLLAKARAL